MAVMKLKKSDVERMKQEYDAYHEHRVVLNEYAKLNRDSLHADAVGIIVPRLPKQKFKNVVDIGCGGGTTLKLLDIRGEKVTLVDFSEGLLETARENARAQFDHVSVIHADLSKNPDAFKVYAPYDLIICSGSLHHIVDEMKAKTIARNIVESLAPGGIFYFSCYRLRKRYFFHEPREGFFLSSVAGKRVFFRRYTKNEVLELFKGLECVLIDDRTTKQDILFLGRKK